MNLNPGDFRLANPYSIFKTRSRLSIGAEIITSAKDINVVFLHKYRKCCRYFFFLSPYKVHDSSSHTCNLASMNVIIELKLESCSGRILL